MTIKKELQTLNKDIKALKKTVENIIKALEKPEKGKVIKVSKKRSPAKKPPAKKKRRSKKPAEECPVDNGTFGVDTDEYDECDECPLWEACEDKRVENE